MGPELTAPGPTRTAAFRHTITVGERLTDTSYEHQVFELGAGEPGLVSSCEEAIVEIKVGAGG